MAQYQGRRGPNVSQYIANLNTIPSANDMAQQQQQQEFAQFDDDLALFTNTDFFDFDLHTNQPSSPNNAEQLGFVNQSGFYNTMPRFPHNAHMSVTNSPLSSPPNGVPFAGQMQQSRPTVPSAQHFAGILQPQQQLQQPQQLQDQKRKAGSNATAGTIPSTAELEESSRNAAEEDKRRRNTAASARFRVKKKQREQALEKTAKEMSERVQVLEARIGQLEMENQWLKGLITEKNVKLEGAPTALKAAPVGKMDAPVAAKCVDVDSEDDEESEVEDMTQLETSLGQKKRGVGTEVEATKA